MRPLLIVVLSLVMSSYAQANEQTCRTHDSFRIEDRSLAVQKALTSVVSVVFRIDDTWNAGTGFVFSHRRYVLTNVHISERFVSRTGNERPEVQVFLPDCTVQAGEVLFMRTAADKHILLDLAVIRISDPPPPLLEGELEMVKEGEEVFALVGGLIRVPEGRRVHQGQLEDKLVFVNESIDETMPFIKFSGRVEKGSSGGPFLDKDMRVLGVTSHVGEDHLSSYAVPIRAVVRLLEYQGLL